MSDIKSIPTNELVEELTNREGVEPYFVEPYETVQVEINGPAIVLKIID